ELEDVAAVWHPDGPFGSGRLIAPGLVLTASHTLEHPMLSPARSGWRVRLLRQRDAAGQWTSDPYDAECVWRGAKVDLALLKIGDRNPQPAYASVFAVLDKEQACDAVGYPRATWDVEGKARELRVSGRLRVESIGYALAFSVPWSDVPSDIAKWKGMSGAAVVQLDSFDRMRVFGAI